MKIGHIVCTYPPYKGGMGNAAQSFVIELEKRGHECWVFTPDYEGVGNDGRIMRLKPWLKYGNAAFIPGLYKELKNIDVIHLHYPFFGAALIVWFFKLMHPSKPLVITYHMDVKGRGLVRIISTMYRWLFSRLILSSANLLTCSSLDYAQNSQMKNIIKLRPFLDLPFGVSDKFFALSNKNEQEFSRRILFVAALDAAHYFKGVADLFEAIKLCEDKRFHLDIVGKGDLLGFYQALVHKNGIFDRVTFRGGVALDELVRLYQQADYTLLPSIDMSEAFGIVLTESMACGTPVIASALPGVRSVVDDGKTGYLVPPSNPLELSKTINKAYRDQSHWQKMRLASSDRVESLYRWPAIIDKLEMAYKKLVNEKSL